MKIIQINAVSYGSTGKIMLGIHRQLLKRGYDSYVVWAIGRNANNDNELFINDKIGILIHKILSRLFCIQGFASWHFTRLLIKKIELINPDVIHLHNLHGNFININMLFNYLKSKKIKIFWTFHDCWAFTGKCVYFDLAKCDKWKKVCHNCPILSDSPRAYVDNTRWCFQKKKKLLQNLDLTIVTPSNWLANLTHFSFLREYPIKVINNGIDIDVFKPTKSDFRDKYNIKDKKIVLGVASPWSKRKGFDDFIKLSKILDANFVIVLIGLSNVQIVSLPSNIIGISRTENQTELAGIYSTADILFNPTYEDNYPTVNLESIACGTPVLTYDTGGSPEFTKYIDDNLDKKLFVIKKETLSNNFNILKDYIDLILQLNFSSKFVKRNLISDSRMVNQYINLYK